MSLPNLNWLQVPDSTIDKLIGTLIVNTYDEFKPEGNLRPILRASVASLLMYDRDVVRDYNATKLPGSPFVHAKLRQSFIDASIFDDRALAGLPHNASDDLKAISTLNLWGEIIRKKFYESNPDFQPLSNSSNSETVIRVMNQLGNTCSSIANENRELRQQVSLLNARVESLDQFIRECIPNIIVQSQEKSFKKLSKCMSLFNLPESPVQSNAMTVTHQAALPPPPMMLSNTNTATVVSTLSSAPPSVAAASASGAVTDNAAGIDVSTTKRPFDGVAASQSEQTIVENYNWKRQRSDGTNLENIVTDAYYNNHFKSGGEWSFTTILKDDKFADNAKFQRCLQLLDVAVTDDKKRELEEQGLDATTVLNVSHSVAKMAMKTILELEDKPQPGKQKTGYTGVGARVQAVMKNKYFITDSRKDKSTLAQAIASGKKTTRITDFQRG